MSTSRGEGPVVVGLDPDPTNRLAPKWAADEANRRHLPLRLVHPRGPGLGARDEHAAQQERRKLLSEAATGPLSTHSDVGVHREVVPRHPVDVLTRESAHALGSSSERGSTVASPACRRIPRARAPHHAMRPPITVGPKAE